MPQLRLLSPGERFDDEVIIGPYPLAEEQTTASMPMPTVERLLHGTRLTVPTPEGDVAGRDPSQAIFELEHWLAGCFEQPQIARWMTFHDSLVSSAQREQFGHGMSIRWDKPRFGFYELSFARTGWQVQATGDPGAFHCVFYGHALAEQQALEEGGHPRALPLGAVEPLLQELAPALPLARLRNQKARHAANVFDAYLAASSITIKAGVRAAYDQRYFYGIRINIVL